jgi:hypothetical protein
MKEFETTEEHPFLAAVETASRTCPGSKAGVLPGIADHPGWLFLIFSINPSSETFFPWDREYSV